MASTVPRRAALRRGSAVALAAVLVTSGCAAGRDAQTANQVTTQDGTEATIGSIALRGLALEAPQSGEYYSPGQAVPMRLVLVNNGQRTDQLTNIVTTKARGWAAFPTEAQAGQVLRAAQSRQQPGSSGPSASTTGSGSPSATPNATSSAPSSPGDTSDTSAPNGSTRPNNPTSPDGSTSPNGSTSANGSVSASASRTQPSLPTGATSVTIPTGRRVSWGVPDSDRGLLLLSATDRIYPGTSVKITFTFARAGSISVVVPVQLSKQPGDLTVAPVSAANEGN